MKVNVNKAIEFLLDEKNLRNQMGRAAKAYVRRDHDLNRNYQIIEDVLCRTLNFEP